MLKVAFIVVRTLIEDKAHHQHEQGDEHKPDGKQGQRDMINILVHDIVIEDGKAGKKTAQGEEKREKPEKIQGL